MCRGGAIVIDYVEVGTFIDVNLVWLVGLRDQEESNLCTNLEVAREIGC